VIVAGQHVRIVVATKPVDFRKGHDGLVAVVQNELRLDPHSGVIVVFRANRADRVKIVVWDGSGLVMIYKRLEQGSFALRGLLAAPLSEIGSKASWPSMAEYPGRRDAAVEGAVRGPFCRGELGSKGSTGGGCTRPESTNRLWQSDSPGR
jgi:hypothetical protein